MHINVKIYLCRRCVGWFSRHYIYIHIHNCLSPTKNKKITIKKKSGIFTSATPHCDGRLTVRFHHEREQPPRGVGNGIGTTPNGIRFIDFIDTSLPWGSGTRGPSDDDSENAISSALRRGPDNGVDRRTLIMA